jgi:endonuclease/exonuclease/phosphatase family metal-dependent hydrolase
MVFAISTVRATITIATYNVENYVVTDRMVDGVFRPAYPKPEAEKAALRRVIEDMSPDILALEEMGPPAYLAELQHDLNAEGCDFPYALVLEAADPDRHVAMLSKLPFASVQRHANVPITLFGRPERVKRGVLEVSFKTTGGQITLFVVHLKSRLTEQADDPESATQRWLEAEAVRDLVLKKFPDPTAAKFAVIGDFNDARTSKPVETFLKRGRTIVGSILPAADSRGELWTHNYHHQDSYSRIDFIVVSPALESLVIRDRAFIHDGPGVIDASDHRPVYFRLNATPVK